MTNNAYAMCLDNLDINGSVDSHQSNQEKLSALTVACQRHINRVQDLRKVKSECGRFIYHICIIDYL